MYESYGDYAKVIQFFLWLWVIALCVWIIIDANVTGPMNDFAISTLVIYSVFYYLSYRWQCGSGNVMEDAKAKYGSASNRYTRMRNSSRSRRATGGYY